MAIPPEKMKELLQRIFDELGTALDEMEGEEMGARMESMTKPPLDMPAPESEEMEGMESMEDAAASEDMPPMPEDDEEEWA